MTCNPNVPTIKKSQGEDNLNKIMGSQKSSFNKEGTCFNPLKEIKRSAIKTSLLNWPIMKAGLLLAIIVQT